MSARPRCSRPSSVSKQPDAGEVKIGETVKLSYVDQNRGGIDPKKNVWEVVSDGLDYIKVGNVEMPVARLRQRVRLQGTGPAEAGRVLSGGERNRLNLALTLKQGGNLILLDEPTNDLDVETLGSLRTRSTSSPAAPW